MDEIIFENECYSLAGEPLAPYLKEKGIEFKPSSTDCWRGYLSSWEVKDNKLYLTELRYPSWFTIVNGQIEFSGKSELNLQTLFPDQKEVFASWFTGRFRICGGEPLHYVHMGYETEYEYEKWLRFDKGIFIQKSIV
jgi:hypothetical protein